MYVLSVSTYLGDVFSQLAKETASPLMLDFGSFILQFFFAATLFVERHPTLMFLEVFSLGRL